MATASCDVDFCEDCLSHLEDLKHRCESLLQKTSHSPEIVDSLKHYQTKLVSLTDIPALSSLHNINMWLKDFSSVLFDLTHVEENILVDEDFPPENGVQRMKDMLQMLDCLLRLKVGDENDICDLLGDDILECVHWRKGSLCYMYCATVVNDANRHTELGDEFLDSARNGVNYLQEMLSLRKRQVEQSDASTNCDDLKYSDIHILAIMYMGELCYWYTKHAKPSTKDNDRSHMRDLGKEQLQLYISLTEAPQQGWDATRAKQLLTLLN